MNIHMRKKTALALGSALMLFATTFTLNAQEQPWSFGVKSGASMSGLQGLGDKKFGDNNSKATLGVGFSGGLTAGYAFHENMGVGLEVLYTGLGGETKEKLGDTAGKAKQFHVRTQNLVVPMMVKFFPMGCDPEEGVLDMHLGFQGEWPLFGATVEKSTANDADKLEDDNSFKKEYLKSVTLSAIVGVGYEFPEIGLTVEGRYSYGFMDIFKDEAGAKGYKEANGLKDKKLVNQFGTVSLGYNFARLLMD